MKKPRKTAYYLIIIALFIAMKLGYKFSTTQDLAFILKPTNKLVEFAMGTTSVYSATQGYYHPTINVIIDKSCAGVNFWILSFVLFAYLFLKYAKNAHHSFWALPMALVAGYLLTLWVNSSRIITSIILQDKIQSFINQPLSIIHEAIGIFINLSFLIIAYLLLEKLILYTTYHEKLS